MMIETRLLYYFLAIAREQSITKAAASLHLSQPTLSKQMTDLETQLGKQLLIRGKRKVTLTEDGAYLRGRAQEMMDLLEKTVSAFQTEDRAVSGDIYLGCGETPFMGAITDVFQKIQNDHPGIKFHIYSGDAEAVLERLDKGLLDMGLLLGPVEQEKYNYLHLKQQDHFGLLMLKDCPLASQKTIHLQDLEKLPLIFPLQTASGQQRLEWFGADYHALHIIATYNLVYNATFMVERGMGYAFCLENLVNTEGNRNLTFRPMEPPLAVDLYIVSKKYQTFSTAAKIFMERLKNSL